MKRIIFYGFLIFVFSIGIGYYYSSLWKSQNPNFLAKNEMKNEIIEKTSWNEEKLSYNASFGLKKNYKECGHSEFQYSELPKEFINMTKDDISKLYSNWNVEEFSSKNLVLSQDIEGYCDEHYVLKIGDDNIEVYKLMGKNKTKFYKDKNISKEYLTSEDLNNLREGIFVYGIKNLNSVIEDFE